MSRSNVFCVIWLLIAVGLAGCGDGLVNEPADPGPTPLETSLRLEGASLVINGVNHGSSISVYDESFTYLFIYVHDVGLFNVVAAPTARSLEAGLFDGDQMRFSAGGVSIEISSRSRILGVEGTRSLWVEPIPNYSMFPGTRPVDVVIGLADTREQIPGAEYLN